MKAKLKNLLFVLQKRIKRNKVADLKNYKGTIDLEIINFEYFASTLCLIS
jgi:hypothetical protein